MLVVYIEAQADCQIESCRYLPITLSILRVRRHVHVGDILANLGLSNRTVFIEQVYLAGYLVTARSTVNTKYRIPCNSSTMTDLRFYFCVNSTLNHLPSLVR